MKTMISKVRFVLLAMVAGVISFYDKARVYMAIAMLPSPSQRIHAEYVGEDMEGDEILGAVRQATRPAPQGRGGAPDRLRTFVGFPLFTWTGTDAADIEQEIAPQRDFQPTGLVIDTTTSLTAAIPLVSVAEVKIGDNSQTPSVGGNAPASMFAHDSLGGAILDFQNCQLGKKISVSLAITAAPGGSDTVTASVGMFGRVVKGQ